jgi:hypothetical protein
MRFRLPLLALMSALLLTSCWSFSTSLDYTDPKRLSQNPAQEQEIIPVEKVNKTLYGFNLLGFRIKSVDPTLLRDRHLENEDHYVTNWQNLQGTIQIPGLAFLFTIPYSMVVFDVVEME